MFFKNLYLLRKFSFCVLLILFFGLFKNGQANTSQDKYNFDHFTTQDRERFQKYFEPSQLKENKHREMKQHATLRLNQLREMNIQFIKDAHQLDLNNKFLWPTDQHLMKKISQQILQRK